MPKQADEWFLVIAYALVAAIGIYVWAFSATFLPAVALVHEPVPVACHAHDGVAFHCHQ